MSKAVGRWRLRLGARSPEHLRCPMWLQHSPTSGTISRGATNLFEMFWLARHFNGLASTTRQSQARDSADYGIKSGMDFTFREGERKRPHSAKRAFSTLGGVYQVSRQTAR